MNYQRLYFIQFKITSPNNQHFENLDTHFAQKIDLTPSIYKNIDEVSYIIITWKSLSLIKLYLLRI